MYKILVRSTYQMWFPTRGAQSLGSLILGFGPNSRGRKACVAGEELVQLYIRLQGTSTAQPVRALKGFQRIALAPGETKKVTFHLEPEAFAIWNDRNEFAVEPAKVTVWISPDSASGSDAKLEILP